RSPRGSTSIRCSQIDAERRRHIPFGRLVWSNKSFLRWTHGAHQPLAASTPWLFEGLEVWSPSWTTVETEDVPPDFFLGVTNKAMGSGHNRQRHFNSVLVAALRTTTSATTLEAFRGSVRPCAQLVHSPLLAYSRRPWGRAFAGGFTDSIQDLPHTGLFRPGQPHDRPVTIDTLQGQWLELPVETAA